MQVTSCARMLLALVWLVALPDTCTSVDVRSASRPSSFLASSNSTRGGSTIAQASSSTPAVWKQGQTVHYAMHQRHTSWWQNDYPSWEPDTFKVFQRFAPGKVVLDIGGWIGPTAMWEGHVAERVVVLEPTSTAFAELRANLQVNPDIASRVVLVNAALDKEDRTAQMTNRGDSTDQIMLPQVQSFVRSVSIDTLRREHPELERVGFVKIDTEGYERVIVPALQAFLKQKQPVVLVSLHPMFITHAEVQGVVDTLSDMCPHLYDVHLQPFVSGKRSYTSGSHGGTDVICSWKPLV